MEQQTKLDQLKLLLNEPTFNAQFRDLLNLAQKPDVEIIDELNTTIQTIQKNASKHESYLTDYFKDFKKEFELFFNNHGDPPLTQKERVELLISISAVLSLKYLSNFIEHLLSDYTSILGNQFLLQFKKGQQTHSLQYTKETIILNTRIEHSPTTFTLNRTTKQIMKNKSHIQEFTEFELFFEKIQFFIEEFGTNNHSQAFRLLGEKHGI